MLRDPYRPNRVAPGTLFKIIVLVASCVGVAIWCARGIYIALTTGWFYSGRLGSGHWYQYSDHQVYFVLNLIGMTLVFVLCAGVSVLIAIGLYRSIRTRRYDDLNRSYEGAFRRVKRVGVVQLVAFSAMALIIGAIHEFGGDLSRWEWYWIAGALVALAIIVQLCWNSRRRR